MKRINTRLLILLLVLVVGGGLGVYLLHGYQASRSSKGSLARAEIHRKDGNYDEAIRAMKQYVRYQRKDTEQFCNLAMLMKEKLDLDFKKNRRDVKFYSEVRQYLEEALRRAPENVKVRDEAIALAMVAGQYTDAIDHLKTKLAKDKSPATLTMLARAYRENNQLEEAIPIVSQLLNWDHAGRKFLEDPPEGVLAESEKNVDTTDAYVMLMQILMTAKEKEAADAVMERLVQRQPESAKAHLVRAQYLMGVNSEDLEPAQEELAKALTLAPDDVDVLLVAGQMAINKRDTLRANATFQRCLELQPDNLNVYLGLVQVASMDKDYEKALGYLNQGLEKSPDDPNFLFYKGTMEIDLRKLDLAEATITKMESMPLRIQPQFAEWLRARIMLQREEWLKAAKTMEEVRPHVQSLPPQFTFSLDMELAQCYSNLGQFDLQLRAAERILDRDGMNLAALMNKINAHLKLRQEEKAVETYDLVDRLIRADPKKTDLLVIERLQLEIMKQKLLPEKQRDWTRADALSKQAESLEITDALRDSLAATLMQAKGQKEAAEELMGKYEDEGGNQMAMRLSALQRRAATETYEQLLPDIEKIQAEIGDNLVTRKLRADVIARSRPDNATELLKQLEANVEEFSDAQKLNLWLLLGRYHVMLSSYDETKRLFTQVIAKRPADVQLRLTIYELALNSNQADDIQTQIDEIEKLVSRDSPEWKWAEGSRLFREAVKGPINTDLLQRASALVDEAILLRPTWGQLYALKGDIQVVEGKSDLALESFIKAKDTGSLNPLIDRSLARLYFDAQRFAEAKRALEELPKPLWTDVESRIELSLLASEGKLPAEIPMDEEKTNADGFVWLGQLLAQVGRNEEATAAFDKALAKDRSTVLAWAGLFSLRLTEGKLDEAKKLAQDALAAIPEKSRSSFDATTSRMLGDNAAAEKAFLVTLQENPDKPEVKQELIKFYLDTNQGAKARPHLQALVDESVGDDPRRAALVRWCRRQLARISASDGTYAGFREAIKLVELNADAGKLSREDLLLTVELAGSRPERASREQALAKLVGEQSTRRLSDDENFALARLYESLGQWSECQSTMVDLLASSPNEPRYLEPWLQWLIEHGDLNSAARWASNLPPGTVASIRVQGLTALKEGRPEVATQLLKDVLSAKVDAKGQLIRLKIVAQLAEEFAATEPKMNSYAEGAWKQLVTKAPENALEFAGYLARLKKFERLKDCIAVCQTVFDQGNQLGAIQQALVAVRPHRGAGPAFDTAMATIGQWIAKRQSADPKLVLLQDCEYAEISGDFAQQEALLRKYLEQYPEKEPRRAVVLNNLAYLRSIQEGGAEESLKMAQEAVDILGPVGSIRDTIGMAELARGKAKEAAEEFQLSIDDDGPTAMKYFHLALARLQAKEEEAAREALTKAEELGLSAAELGTLEMPSYRELIKQMKAAGLSVTDLTQNSPKS